MRRLNLFILSVFLLSSCTQTDEAESNVSNDAIVEQCENLLIDREPSSLTSVDAKKVAMMFVGGDTQTRTAMPVSEILELNDDNTGTPLLYVINFGTDNGYVVVSASKKTPPVLAYSDKGKFVMSNDNPSIVYLNEFKDCVRAAKACNSDTLRLKYAMQWVTYEKRDLAVNSTRALSYEMQQKLDKEVAYRESQGYIHLGGLSAAQYYLPSEQYELLKRQMEDCTDPQYNYMETTQLYIKSYDYEVIDGMLRTKWHQEEPFNVDAKNGLAGCVPIAVAQIVYYHKFPSKYNWKNIYVNPVENDDFNYFIKDIRNLCDVKYNSGGTASNIDKAKSALQSLGYKVRKVEDNIQFTLRSQIHLGNPVYMRGEASGEDKHAWVCDGYQNKKYDAITTFIPNKSDPRFKHVPTSPNGFAAYELSIYPASSLNGGMYGEFYHMNLGWGGRNNGWYRTSVYVPSEKKSYVYNQKVLTVEK